MRYYLYRSTIIIILFSSLFTFNCNRIESFQKNEINGTWIQSYSIHCAEDTVYYHKPIIWHTVEITNNADSIFTLTKRNCKISLDNFNFLLTSGNRDIMAGESIRIDIYQNVPRTEKGFCNVEIIEILKQKSKIIKMELFNLPKDSRDRKKIAELKIKKSKEYKFFPLGEYPEGVLEPESFILEGMYPK